MSSGVRFGFDLVAPDDDWALHCSLALNAHFATWWAVLARVDAPLLIVRDEALQLPKRGMEVRGSGLWADVHCHEPGQRWQVNFEGIALGLDPSEVGANEVGDLVPVEFEFEWEATGPPRGDVQPCMVDGEVQIGDGHLVLETPTRGYWVHS